jgi:hypothetical protein
MEMSKPSSRASAARRNAEALLSKAQKREQTFKLDQEREHEAMMLKTARLRELRLRALSSRGGRSRPSSPRTPSDDMAFKPNYNQQRADRNRAKAQKKQEKLKRLEEETAKRKAARSDEPGADKPPEDA